LLRVVCAFAPFITLLATEDGGHCALISANGGKERF
jgi:hypothetical protein